MKKIPYSPFATRLSGSAKETELRIRNIFQWKKKRPPVILFVLVAALVLLCFGLVSCEPNRGGTDPETQTMEAMDTFLTEFFQFNKQQRYDKFIAAAQGTTDAEALEAANLEYYQPFIGMTTENCLNTMRANRFPLKYDAIAAAQNASPQIQEIQYEPLDGGGYAFEITYEAGAINDVFPTPIKGWIMVEVTDQQVLVDSITIASRPKSD